jgi:DNA-binding HxlR family transcriptional regulator
MAIYVTRGLEPSLAKQVAEQLMAHDALGAHARDELGISETYSLSSYGRTLGPVVQMMCSWGRSHLKRLSARR